MIRLFLIFIMTVSICIAAKADEPLRSKKLKIATCEAIGSYLGSDDGVNEKDCLNDFTFTVTKSEYSEDINKVTYLKVLAKSDIKECTIEHVLEASLVKGKIKYYWRSDAINCIYEGAGNALLLELSEAVDMNDYIWGGENGVFQLETSIEEHISERKEELEKIRDEYPDSSFVLGGNYALSFLQEDWALGGCFRCAEVLDKIKDSGMVAHGIVWDNGNEEDYLETNVTLILKDGYAFHIYFGN